MAYELSGDQIDQVYQDDPEVYYAVTAHAAFLAANGWNQVAFATRTDLPIPIWGVAFDGVPLTAPDGSSTDVTLIIYPDAQGLLHYIVTQTAAEQAVAAEIQKPMFQSPPGSISQDLLDLLAKLNAMVSSAASGLGAGAGGIGLGLGLGLVLLGLVALRR